MQPPPAWDEFLAAAGSERLVGQVLFRQTADPRRFHLRHEADRDRPAGDLKPQTALGLRTLAQTDPRGAFRPLRLSPDLVTGWCFDSSEPAALFEALQEIYPGAVADWHAARHDPSAATHYRDFAGRQTGMFRLTAQLPDAEVGAVTQSCCAPRFCLRRRLWTVPGLDADGESAKSIIPCLEPCSLLMELARRGMRVLQEEPTNVPLRSGELETLEEALRFTLDERAPERHADFADAANPRRLQALLERLSSIRAQVKPSPGRPTPAPAS